MRALVIIASFAALAAAPVLAQGKGEIGYPKGSLGYDALVKADYATAEAQLRGENGVARSDPARLINLGQLMAMTGREAEAQRLFKRVLAQEDVELVLADDRTIYSHDAARAAIRELKTNVASR